MRLLPGARETLYCIMRDTKSISIKFERGDSQENFHNTSKHTQLLSGPGNRNQIFYIFLPSIAPSFAPSAQQQRAELQLVNKIFDMPDLSSKEESVF